MGLRMIAPKRVKKAKSANSREVLDRLQRYLDSGFEEPIEILCGFWQDQQDAISYQELRQAVNDGEISQDTINLWRQDYAILIAGKFSRIWSDAISAGAAGQPLLDGRGLVFDANTPGLFEWIRNRGAQFVTACTEEQQRAISALLEKKMRDSHTVDELARMIRPCIGLTEADAKSVMRYYDSVVASYRNDHPRMKPESIRRRARDAAQKYAERKHRQRAYTIAQTESAFAYNRGADEGIRQAQRQNLIGTIKKRWSTSGDDGVCDICAALDGTEIDMDAEFSFRGKLLFAEQKRLPPAHPRCACAVEYIETESPSSHVIVEAPMPTGDKWIDDAIEDYDSGIVWADGDEAMASRLLISHDNVRYVKDETLSAAFEYRLERDAILYNPNNPNIAKYDLRFALTHENAHRVDYLELHSWKNEKFMAAINNAESLVTSNMEAIEELMQSKSYRYDMAFNDLISALTRGKANDILLVGHSAEYLLDEQDRAMEIFADITSIDMSNSSVKSELKGIFFELYNAYKEVVAWKS